MFTPLGLSVRPDVALSGAKTPVEELPTKKVLALAAETRVPVKEIPDNVIAVSPVNSKFPAADENEAE
jgi:hypothetical protein